MLNNIYHDNCRLCGSPILSEIFSIGDFYINDFPPSPEKKGRNGKCPLDLIMCKNCNLFQLRHTAPQELMYRRFYWYKSGINETINNDLKEISKIAVQLGNLQENDIVLDIGANDGTLLRHFKQKAIRVGCEPANNLIEDLNDNCEYLINDFWNEKYYRNLNIPKAKIITAIGMFYDMEDPNQFISDAAKALTEGGVFIAQLMCLKNMMDTNDVGNICHEHLEFYSFHSLEYLFEHNGLEVFDVEINNVNGASYRLFARKKGADVTPAEGADERIARVRQDEEGLDGKKVHLEFFERLETNKTKCVAFIKREVAKGKKVWVYGASTKGNVILQYYGLDHTLIEAAAERSPAKWGKYTVGSMIPCVSEEEARKAQPDYFLMLPYAFFDEFYEREHEWREKGGKFIVPLPDFKVVS